MAYKVIILYQLYMPSYFLGTFTEYPHLKVWQQEGTPKGSFLHYTEQERLLLDYLTTHPAITLNQYCRLARIPRIKAENTLAKFIRFELIEPIFENHRFYFRGCT